MIKEPSNPASASAEAPCALNRDTQPDEPTEPNPARATGQAPPDGSEPRRLENPGSFGAGTHAGQPGEPGNPAAAEGIDINGQGDTFGEPVAREQGDMPPSESEPAALPEAIRRKLLNAEIRTIGAEMGLLDAEAALRLMPPEAVTVNAQGEVAGVREALTALQQHKGYLFARAARGAWAQRMGDSAPRLTGVEVAFYRKNPTLRK